MFKIDCQKDTASNIKMTAKQYTNRSGFKKHTNNLCPKNPIMMTNIKLKEYQDVVIVWQVNQFLIK